MTAPSTTLTTVAYAFKATYAQGVGDAALRLHPYLMMITKPGGFTGSDYRYAVKYGNAASVSGSFTQAQTGAASSKGLQFTALRWSKFGVVNISGEAIRASGDTKGALLDLMTGEVDSVVDEHTDRLAFDLQRDQSGVRGQRASAATNVITLADPDTARNFKIGMIVGASTGANGITGARVGTTSVAGVSLAAGTVTLTSAAAITAFADNDFIFAAGDPGTCIEGLEVCTPLTAPIGGDSFRGKDRSVYPELLAGSRINDTSTLIEDNAGLAAIAVQAAGGRVDSLFLNPVRFYQVSRRMNAKVEYDGGGGEGTFGFERIVIATPGGTLKVYSDPDVALNRGRGARQEAQQYRTLGDLVHIINDDGNMNLRDTDADGVEARTRSMGNLIQPNPRDAFVIAI